MCDRHHSGDASLRAQTAMDSEEKNCLNDNLRIRKDELIHRQTRRKREKPLQFFFLRFV